MPSSEKATISGPPTEGLVFYADCLGFKELVNKAVFSKDESSRKKIDTFFAVVEDFSNRVTGHGGTLLTLSDSVLAVIPKKDEAKADQLRTLCRLIQELQIELLGPAVFLRGAITFGAYTPVHSSTDRFRVWNVWGKPIEQAHKLEGTHAIFPRVVLDPTLIKELGLPDRDSLVKLINVGNPPLLFTGKDPDWLITPHFSQLRDFVFIDYLGRVLQEAVDSGNEAHLSVAYEGIKTSLFLEADLLGKAVWVRSYGIAAVRNQRWMKEIPAGQEVDHIRREFLKTWEEKFSLL